MKDRRMYFGGGDAGMIMGLDPYNTPLDLFLRKTTPNSREWEDIVADSHDIRRGNFMEPVIADWCRRNLEPDIGDPKYRQEFHRGAPDDPQTFVLHPDYDFIGGHPDDLSADTVWEYKAPRMYKVQDILGRLKPEMSYEEMMERGLPASWFAQVQHYIMCTGKNHGKIVIWNYDNHQPFVVHLKRNQPFIDELLSRYLRLWEAIQTGEVPDFGELKAHVVTDDDLDGMASEYSRLQDLYYRTMDYRKSARSLLLTALTNRDKVRTDRYSIMVSDVDKGDYSYKRLVVKDINN